MANLLHQLLRLDYVSCVLTILGTILLGRKLWQGWVVAAVNSAVVCVIGVRTAQFGFVPANLLCIALYTITLSLGASVPPTMPPNRTPRRAQTHGLHAGPSRRRTGRRRPRFRRITIARFLQNERAGATAIPRWSARSETK